MSEIDATSERRRGHVRPEVAAGRARLRADAVGTLVHESVALALATRRDGEFDVVALARTVVGRRNAPVHRLAQTHRVATATATYLRALRRPPCWQLMGSEVQIGDIRMDLLFVERGTGRVEADELKTGLLGPALELPWVREQLRGQLELGRATFGTRFGGVRLVELAPRRATLVERVVG